MMLRILSLRLAPAAAFMFGLGLTIGASLTVGAGPASAQTAVDLQLVLAVDASGSVNDVRFELQKQGRWRAARSCGAS